MSLRRQIRSLRRENAGAAAVEFGLLAPIVITMLMGVFQIGMGMQNYNALRDVSADTARRAMVEYQNARRRDDAWLEAKAIETATKAPYKLAASRLTVDIANATSGSQYEVSGVTAKTMTMQYTVPTVLQIIGMDDITLSYTRPIYLIS